MPRGKEVREQKPLMRVTEAARLLGLSPSRGYVMVQRGLIPAIRIGHAVRVPREAFEKWMRGHVEAALESVKRSAEQVNGGAEGKPADE
jgi:excisionase family DNA binding protein